MNKTNGEYEVIEWEYRAYVEQMEIILSTTKAHIHKVRLKDDECVYIVSEDVYRNCIRRKGQKEGKK